MAQALPRRLTRSPTRATRRPDATQLASIDALYVVNSSNTSYGAEYTDNLADISAVVNDGMNLIIFDRYVTDANPILPGVSACQLREMH